ncbi:hypothetical protein Hanom_Chr06g00564201 [Helianthus anomalus]
MAKFRQERVADEEVTEELRQQVKKLKEEKKWLIGTGIHCFVTYLLHSQEFNVHLAGIYTKAMAHGRHTCLIAGVDWEAIEKLPTFNPDSLPTFLSVVKTMEVLFNLYVEDLSQMVDRPVDELGALESEGLNTELCEQLLSVASVKRALFETSDEESGDVGPSTKKLKVTEEPEPVSFMSIPIDAPPLSFVRGEPAPLVADDDEGLDDPDGLYDDLP